MNERQVQALLSSLEMLRLSFTDQIVAIEECTRASIELRIHLGERAGAEVAHTAVAIHRLNSANRL